MTDALTATCSSIIVNSSINVKGKMYFFDTFLRKADPLSAENASEGCSEKRWIYIRGKRIHTHICNCFLIPIYYNLSQKKSNELSHPGMKAKKISENVKNGIICRKKCRGLPGGGKYAMIFLRANGKVYSGGVLCGSASENFPEYEKIIKKGLGK